MIIDGLKPFLYQLKPKNADFNPIKSVVETFFRTVITFDGKALVIECDNNFTLELVNNSKNSWETLEFDTFNTKDDLFNAIKTVVLAQYKANKPTIKESDLSTKQKVLLRQERILKCIEKKPLTILEIAKLLKLEYQETSRSIQILKNKNKITEHRNDLQKSYQVS